MGSVPGLYVMAMIPDKLSFDLKKSLVSVFFSMGLGLGFFIFLVL